MSYYDERGRRLDLIGEGHRGGEGAVHAIAGDRSRVAKIYHAARLGDGLHTKLRIMLEQPPDDPSWKSSRHRSIAWVDGLVFADTSGRELRGFTMPAVDTSEFRQAHVYYDAADRLQIFGGGFTWRHLLYSAHNLTSAVAAVHAAGHRVVDLRETNLLVAPSSLVTLIDCDSFQIKDRRTRQVYPTRVATGDYLPPELQGVDFRTQNPDRYHADLFALAVLVFRFLMLGVHPFQARGAGVTDAPTTEAKIRKGLFAFAGRRRDVEPPEYAPPFAIVPAGLQALFARAFVDGHGNPDARPSAADWVTALEREGSRLRTCTANPNHLFAHRLRSCPWCRISPDPFPSSAAVGRQIVLESAPGQAPEAARIQHLRAYARVALADGSVTDPEFAYLRKAGGELGLRTAVIDRVIDDEAKSAPPGTPRPPSPPSPPAGVTATPRPPIWTRTRASVARPLSVVRPGGDRRLRSAVKAAAPVLVLSALAGALAPIVAPVAIAVLGLPMLAISGDVHLGRSWRTWARVPLSFGLHLHRSLGHAARLFVPVAVIGAAASTVPGVRPEWVVRASGAAAAIGLAWLAIARLPFASDRSAPGLRAGRDLVWSALVGQSGRTRRPAYALWAVCIGGALARAANSALRWPLPLPLQ